MNFLENFSGRLVFTTHRRADIDGLACAVALKEHFGSGDIVIKSVSREGREFMKKLGVDYSVSEVLPDADAAIVVDCLSPSQTGYEKFPKKVGLIDHHFDKSPDVDHYLVKDRPSCAEIVYGMVSLTDLSKRALLSGIVSDTGFFRFADSETFSAVAELTKDVSLDQARLLVFHAARKDEKIAKLKCAQRMRVVSTEPLLVVSEVGSYEAEAASALVRLGADIALVVSDRNSFFRTSVRSRKVGIHFGRLFSAFAETHGGEGGGHDCAATMNTPKRHTKQLLSEINRLMDPSESL